MELNNKVAFHGKSVEDRQIDTLVGLCNGILADGIVNKEEAAFLHNWLHSNVKLGVSHKFIGNLFVEIEPLIKRGLRPDDHDQLVELLTRFTGGPPDDDEYSAPTDLPLCRPKPVINLRDAMCVFTGTFRHGTRKECHKLNMMVGGMCNDTVTLKTRYVIIGGKVSKAWKHESFGRKIEKAARNRDEKGCNLTIINEESWLTEAMHPKNHDYFKFDEH